MIFPNKNIFVFAFNECKHASFWNYFMIKTIIGYVIVVVFLFQVLRHTSALVDFELP